MVDMARNQAHGGKTVYGACVGILMLETRFPRIPGLGVSTTLNRIDYPQPVGPCAALTASVGAQSKSRSSF